MLLTYLFYTVDQIYHLASPASPPNYMYNPIKTLKTNTIGTLNMLGEYMYLLNKYSFTLFILNVLHRSVWEARWDESESSVTC